SNATNSIENLKIKEEMQWEDSHNSTDPSSVDLHKFYSAKQWEMIHNLIQSIGFNDIDDMNILSGDNVAKTFEQSQKKIIKIREDALLLFGFKTRAKGMPDLNATIKFINAILSNWCGYIVKSSETHVGPRTNRVQKKTYWINRVPDNGAGFETQEEIMAIKLNVSNYCPINPVLPPYKPESVDKTQELFDSIPATTDIVISKETKLRCSASFSNEIREESSCNNIVKKSMTNLLQLSPIVLTQNQSNTSEQFSSITKAKIEIPESLISLSSEFLIKNKSDVDILIYHLQEKFSMSQERLKKWKGDILFEMRDNHNYWKKERESMSKTDFLKYKQNFEAKMKVPTTPYKKELKNRSLALIEYI
ncbi:6229_t:CDS:1, partial [Gigaspora margarita]